MARNKGFKLLSLFLAVALWFAVGGEERTEVTLNVPLELTHLSPDLVVTSEVPPALQVRVIGPRSLVRGLTQSRLIHTLDLSGYKAGRHSFPLGPNSFSFPRGVVVSRVQPNPISLALAANLTKTLPVQPVLSGQPPEGYELKGVKIMPAEVTVQGPGPELAGLNAIPTLPISLSNLTSAANLATDLDFKNLHLTLKTSGPIMAEITIVPKIVKKTLNGISVTAAPQRARLQPAQVTVALEGPFNLFKDIDSDAIKASVDTKNLKPGRHRLKIAVTPPSGLKLLSISPDTLTATIGKTAN